MQSTDAHLDRVERIDYFKQHRYGNPDQYIPCKQDKSHHDQSGNKQMLVYTKHTV